MDRTLSRRAFLNAAGAVGGSTAVFRAAVAMGLLPAAGILKPATEHPARRNALMIASHLVWGAALGALLASRSPAPGTATACP